MGIGVYMPMTMLIDDTKINLNSINECFKSKSERPQISKQLLNTIHFHSVVKQLSEIYLRSEYKKFKTKILFFLHRIVRDFSKIAQNVFMVVITWGIVMISGGMLMIRSQIVEFFLSRYLHFYKLKTLNSFDLILSAFCVFHFIIVTRCK